MNKSCNNIFIGYFEGDRLYIDINLKLKKDCIDYKDMQKKDMMIFSMSARTKNMGGQIFDDIFNNLNLLELKNKSFKKVFDFLYKVWLEYHLNDLKAGKIEQETFIKQLYQDKNFKYDYTKVCALLKENNLYEINGYKYGHAWLCQEIPQNIINRLSKIIDNLDKGNK